MRPDGAGAGNHLIVEAVNLLVRPRRVPGLRRLGSVAVHVKLIVQFGKSYKAFLHTLNPDRPIPCANPGSMGIADSLVPKVR